MNECFGRYLYRLTVCIVFLSVFAGCATFSPENVARSNTQCLESGGNYINKVIACDIAINSGKYAGADLANLYRMKGVHQQIDGRNYEAIASFGRALQLNPNDSDSYYFRAISEQRIGNSGAAQQDFDMSQQLKSRQGVAGGTPGGNEMIERQQPFEQQGPEQAPMAQESESENNFVPYGPPPPQVEGWGRPALSRGELAAVMRWIALRVASDRQPYCYRKSYGRTIGKPLSVCRDNEEKNGALCYPRCRQGFKGVGPVCWQYCPDRFRDIGVSCAKPAAYGRGGGFPWKFGDKLNDRGMFHRCEKRYGRGKCEKYGAIVYPKCKAGYKAFGSNICTPKCPGGMRDDGAFCAKRSYGRGVGKPLRCPAGSEQNGALCYPVCKRGFHGVGPVCWQNCPADRTACGAGCAKNSRSCLSNTANMVIAPAILASNIVSGGGAGMLAKYKNIEKAIRLGSKTYAAGNAGYQAGKTTKLWVDEYVGSFGVYTSPEVVRQIDSHFQNPEARLWVEQRYALYHLALMLRNDLGETGQNMLEAASGFDPSGITGVISAFNHPVCSREMPFPRVHPYY